ncbi:MAG: MATE family efflux transporter [Candidatus Latescibacterota bacterium]|nr:MAG: MATE family efflux transporter [Candidatus Latescibacterota bacterium]
MNAPRVARTRPPSTHLNREILRLAIPSFFATITVPLVGIADTALVGQLGPVAFIGAVSIGSMVFDALYWVFGFLRMGTTAIVAQAYGAGDDARAGQTLLQSATLALLLGVSIILLRQPIATLGLRLAGGTPEVQRWAYSYIEIRILGAPAVLLLFALSGFFRGMKDAVTPLVVTLVLHVVNVVGDVLLIHGLLGLPKLGVVGAAWASLFGALAGVSVALAVLAVRYNHALRAGWHAAGLFSPRRLRRLLATQTHLFNRTLLLMAAYFVMVAVAARLGEVPLAANAILLQLWYLSAYSIDGVALACETLVGNALGAGEASLTRRLIGRATLWGLAISGVYALLYLFGMRLIAAAFTRDPEVVRTVVGLTWIMVLLQPINAIAFVFDGVFIGANDTRFLSLQIAVSCLGVFVPAVLLLAGVLHLGLAGLWIAMALFSTARAVILAARCKQPAWIERRLREAALV